MHICFYSLDYYKIFKKIIFNYLLFFMKLTFHHFKSQVKIDILDSITSILNIAFWRYNSCYNYQFKLLSPCNFIGGVISIIKLGTNCRNISWNFFFFIYMKKSIILLTIILYKNEFLESLSWVFCWHIDLLK